MKTVLDQPCTTVAFCAWEDQQLVQHECDRQPLIPMSGASIIRQRVMRHSRIALSPPVPQAGFVTAPDRGVRCPRRSAHQSLTFTT